LKYADVVIEPQEIHQYSKFSFTNIKEMYEIGYRETLKHMEEIKEAVHKLAVAAP
jgi:hypothetical protein